ncbi:hypothetical protein Rs2_11253 [Raphanus sativus]|nr:hypothetical protein Rs2_11253 [Raphanus sativus]
MALKVVAFPASFLPPPLTLTSKKPKMTVKCYTGNQRDEARVKSELGKLHTKLGRLRSNGEILEANKVFEDEMHRLGIPLTQEVKQLSNEKRSGPFKTGLFDISAQIKKRKAFDVKKRVKLPLWSRSRKRNRKQKIPPKKDEKTKEDAANEGDTGKGANDHNSQRFCRKIIHEEEQEAEDSPKEGRRRWRR